jgi:hypothetical protein
MIIRHESIPGQHWKDGRNYEGQWKGIECVIQGQSRNDCHIMAVQGICGMDGLF